MTIKERMNERIRTHGENLKAVFGMNDADAVKLSKQLHKLETDANREMTRYCNGDIDMDGIDAYTERLSSRLARIIGAENMTKIYINRDPRGYTLKLTESATKAAQDKGIMIHRDWGGYGILAPEFDGKE